MLSDAIRTLDIVSTQTRIIINYAESIINNETNHSSTSWLNAVYPSRWIRYEPDAQVLLSTVPFEINFSIST